MSQSPRTIVSPPAVPLGSLTLRVEVTQFPQICMNFNEYWCLMVLVRKQREKVCAGRTVSKNPIVVTAHLWHMSRPRIPFCIIQKIFKINQLRSTDSYKRTRTSVKHRHLDSKAMSQDTKFLHSEMSGNNYIGTVAHRYDKPMKYPVRSVPVGLTPCT